MMRNLIIILSIFLLAACVKSPDKKLPPAKYKVGEIVYTRIDCSRVMVLEVYEARSFDGWGYRVRQENFDTRQAAEYELAQELDEQECKHPNEQK